MIPLVLADLPPARIPAPAYLGVLVARKQWPDNPCNGHERVILSGTPPRAAGPLAMSNGRTMVGWADLDGRRCRIWLNSAYMSDRTAACKITVHELGHWEGLDHAPGGIMAPLIEDMRLPACEIAHA
jgi:hypothetical protein